MSAKSYIVKKINELPTFTGALSPDDLVAFYDISTGITHKIKVSEIGLPAGSLSFLDEKLTSTQDLPSLNLLSGATQKEVNAAQNTLNNVHEQRLDAAEAQLAGNQLTFASIYGYYNFI